MVVFLNGLTRSEEKINLLLVTVSYNRVNHKDNMPLMCKLEPLSGQFSILRPHLHFPTRRPN